MELLLAASGSITPLPDPQLLDSANSPCPPPSRLLLRSDRDLLALPSLAVWWPLMQRCEEEQGAEEDDEAPIHVCDSCTERANSLIVLRFTQGRGVWCAPHPCIRPVKPTPS